MKLDSMKYLTIEDAKRLQGKKVLVYYPGYLDQDGTIEFVIGEVVSELEYYRHHEKGYKGKYPNRAEEWESRMNPSELQEHENKLLLLDHEGNRTYLYTYKDSGVFNCGDDDRYCKFKEVI